MDWERLSRLVDAMEEACLAYDQDAQRLLLQELVPELRAADENTRAGRAEAAQENVIALNRYNA